MKLGCPNTKVKRVVIISASSQDNENKGREGKVVDDQVLSVDRTKRSTDLKDMEKRSIDGLKRTMTLHGVPRGKMVDDQVLSVDRTKRSTDLKNVVKR